MTDLETVKEWALQDRENGISLGEDDYEVFLQYCDEAGIQGNWDLFDYYLNVVEGMEDEDVDESLDLRKPDRILEGMKPEQFRYLAEIAESIGIYTLGDLEKFLKTEFPESNGVIDDNTVEYLIQYKKELGPDFKIKEELDEEDDMTDLELAERLDKALREGSDHEKGNDRKCCEVDPESSVVDPDNSIIDCKKYTVVAHCDDEAPVDCDMKKPPLEKPLTEEIKTPTGRMTACLNSVNNKIAQLVDEIEFAEDILKKDFEKDPELKAKFQKVLNSMIVDIIGIDAARSVEPTKDAEISETTDVEESLTEDIELAEDAHPILNNAMNKLFTKFAAKIYYSDGSVDSKAVDSDCSKAINWVKQNSKGSGIEKILLIGTYDSDILDGTALANRKGKDEGIILVKKGEITADKRKELLQDKKIVNKIQKNAFGKYGKTNDDKADKDTLNAVDSEKAEEPAKAEPAKSEPVKTEEPAKAPEEPTKERSEKQKAVTAKMSQQKKSTKAVFDALVKSGLMSQDEAKAAAQNEKDDATGKTKFNTSKIAKFKKELADANGKIELVASAQGEVQNFSDALLENID